MSKPDPFKYFKSSLEIIRVTVMMYVRYSLSLRNVEDLLLEHGVEINHETVRFWWNRFALPFAAEIRCKRVERMQPLPHRRWQALLMAASTISVASIIPGILSGATAFRLRCQRERLQKRGIAQGVRGLA
jgi:hypothetical protein